MRADVLHPAARSEFFPGGAGLPVAALCAEMSRLAYVEFESGATAVAQVRSALRPLGYAVADSDFFVTDRAKGYLARSPKQSILAFRGTDVDDPTDLGTDADAILTNWQGGGKVHTGFRNAILPVWPPVSAALATVQGALLFTGHSLGAALATLAASLSPRKPDALYTIGSPRVGDADFAATLAALPSFRYQNCCDIVCRIPPDWMKYQHICPPQYISSSGAVSFNPPEAAINEDQETARIKYLEQQAWRIGTNPVRDLADHAPTNYFSALAGLRPAA